MSAGVQFNLQTFLSEMRDEQREDHLALSGKIDTLVTKVAEHDTKITVLDNHRKTTRWLAGSLVIAFIGATADFLFVHVPKLLASGRP